MIIDQIYTGCLAQGAYYIESDGEAAIIDPLRSPAPYLKRANDAGAKIKYIFETHFHADFVSGHLDLAKESGATIVYGPGAKTDYAKHTAHDMEDFHVGKLTIRALHTPGHTLESTCYLLLTEEGKPHALFSGDTLFIGDVGRPDLAQKSGALTVEDLAGLLYESLRRRIMVLPDDVIVYPAHGAGSACGKKMSRETQDTLGNQKETNYALRTDMTRAEFIREVTDGLLPPPAYFGENVRLNKEGYESFEKVMDRSLQALPPAEFERAANNDRPLLLDVRDKAEFVKGFVPNSIFIGLDGSFAPWVGELVPDLKQPILLIVDAGREAEAAERLSRVGYDGVLGYLEGGIEAWKSYGGELDQLETIDAHTFGERLRAGKVPATLDVRKEAEFKGGHLSVASNVPLNELSSRRGELSKAGTIYVHCGSGYRSTIATSLLKSRGVDDIVNVQDKVALILGQEVTG
ncbi:MBL fold metallo-hydrolase [Neolewinella antarctica]|uniref:Glyoxylase-like metal-dependent hydrolase (Beta-lactamase superfamily II)/rhodanese-related sulfurtransferase n=1 Tax=Neolewinella antarctica TaxID=442734 RepID=A0ABX0XFJ7_9BACT|nr:MBL fold metallo-hydrolase [Neolewinella antarctica]NJC27679.1 glyoxylase-like metal-dependent hydrolase (beta-lactamase superfamily II)/rhodanese-related sulfurtransferase [Neolewinella antarctica]